MCDAMVSSLCGRNGVVGLDCLVNVGCTILPSMHIWGRRWRNSELDIKEIATHEHDRRIRPQSLPGPTTHVDS